MNKVKLGDYIEAFGDGIHGTPVYDENGEYFFINGNNLIDGEITIDENTLRVSKTEYEKIKRPLGENTLLLSINGTLGRVAEYKNEKIALGKSACFLNIKDNVNKDFVRYVMLTQEFQKYILLVAHGSTIKNLAPSQVADYEFSIPDSLDVNRMADLLKVIDNKIKNNKKINAELESMAKTIYDYWFLQFEFPNEEGKPYKSSGGKMVWNEELKREIPEGWNTTTIGDITICHDSERIPLSGKDRESMIGDIPYYGATDIMGYVNRPIFDGNYVLLAEDGSVMDEDGHPILQRVTGQVWVNNHAHVLEPIKNHSCKLLMMFLKDVNVPMIKTGSIQMKINQENMNGITVPNIPEDIKDKINLELYTIERKQLQIIAENRELASLRDFLLPMLMNGQIGFK